LKVCSEPAFSGNIRKGPEEWPSSRGAFEELDWRRQLEQIAAEKQPKKTLISLFHSIVAQSAGRYYYVTASAVSGESRLIFVP